MHPRERAHGIRDDKRASIGVDAHHAAIARTCQSSLATGFERRSGALRFLGTTPLSRAELLGGKALATLYLHGTTHKDGWPLADVNRWWVGAGAPTLLVEQRADETDPIGLNVQGVFPA